MMLQSHHMLPDGFAQRRATGMTGYTGTSPNHP
jgi:hypothetical protein